MNDFNMLQATNKNDAYIAVQEKICAMNASSISTRVQQSPTSDNNNVAICQTKLIVDGKRISMCGIATPETSQSDKPHILLADALCSSMNMAIGAIQSSTDSKPPFAESPFPTNDINFESSMSSKFNGKHNPKKPISENQKKYIIGLANKQGLSADDAANQVCEKDLSQCSSADADRIINHFKS